jgi:group I intron endonuclease
MPSEKCFALVRAIQKYGKENFTVEQIDVASDREELNSKERYWIEHYDSIAPKGYNLKSGGNENIVYSEETRRKISEANTGKTHSAETREKLSKAFTGRKLSEKTKAKMSESRMGRVVTPDTRAKISNSLMGHSFTEDTRRKMSAAQRNKVISEETRQRMKESNARRRAVTCVEDAVTFESVAIAASIYKTNSSHIASVCRGERKTAGGHHWKYAE